jgi:hypothetical protein
MTTTTLTGRALKVTVVLNPMEIGRLQAVNGQSRVEFRVQVAGRIVTTNVSAKSVRKANTTIAEAGVDGCAAILQGRLVGECIEDAGLAVMPKLKTTVT